MYGCITKEILFSNKYKSSWTLLLFSLYTLTGFRFGWFNLRQKNIARDMDNMVHSNGWQVQNGVSYITYFYTNYWLGSFFACNYWQIVENNFCCNKTIYFRPQISVALLDIYTLAQEVSLLLLSIIDFATFPTETAHHFVIELYHLQQPEVATFSTET